MERDHNMPRYERYYSRDNPEAAEYMAQNRDNYRKTVEMMGHLQGLIAAKFRTDPVDGEHVAQQEEIIAQVQGVIEYVEGTLA